MIFTERTITVRKGTSTINESIILYRGDFQVGLKFTILDSKYKFLNGANLIESEKATYAQLAVLKPKGDNIFSGVVKCSEGSVTFTMTKEMIDELEEVGKYSFQIRLFDANKESRVSIPPVEFGMEVREPVASEDHNNEVNKALTGYSIAKVTTIEDDKKVDAFDSNGKYVETKWKTGDRITENKLNKVEGALTGLSQNGIDLDRRMTTNFNILQSTKTDRKELDDVKEQVNNLVLGATGDGNNAEIIQARGIYTTVNDRLTVMGNTTAGFADSSYGIVEFGGSIDYVELISGQYTSSLTPDINGTRCCVKTPILIPEGTIISLGDYTNYSYSLVYQRKSDGQIMSSGGWRTNDSTMPHDGYLMMSIRKNTNGGIKASEYDTIGKLVRLYKNTNFKDELNTTLNEKFDSIETRQEKEYYKAYRDVDVLVLGRTVVKAGEYILKEESTALTKGVYKCLIEFEETPSLAMSYLCIRQYAYNASGSGTIEKERNIAKCIANNIYAITREIKEGDDWAPRAQLFIDNREGTKDLVIKSLRYVREVNTVDVEDINNIIEDFKKAHGFYSYKTLAYSDTPITLVGGYSDTRSYIQPYLEGDKLVTCRYFAIIETDDVNGLYGSRIMIRQSINGVHNAVKVAGTHVKDGVYKIIFESKALTDTDSSNVMMFIDFRDASSSTKITIKSYKITRETTVSTGSGGSGEVIKYVSPTGNDGRDGDTKSTALATIAKAISLGATTVMCERGDYYNQPAISLSGAGNGLRIIPIPGSEGFSYDKHTRKPINIVNATEIIGLTSNSGILEVAHPKPNQAFIDVFINKTKPPIAEGSRTDGCNAQLWQIHEDIADDTKLIPVLTKSELLAKKGTFFFDGSTLYINPYNTNYTKFMMPDVNNVGIDLRALNKLVLEDVYISYSYVDNFRILGCMNATITNCHSKYAGNGQGFMLDGSNVNLYWCNSYKSRNDGFNIHNYGISNFYDCNGLYNYDDGVSHHDGCIGTIDGGEWAYNGKGGIASPTYGAQVMIKNAESHHNGYGIYAASDKNAQRPTFTTINNCVLYDNKNWDLKATKATVKLVNSIYGTKSADSGGVIKEFKVN